MKNALAALALTLSGAAAAGDKMTDAEMVSVQRALDRGQLLYAYDQAAWHATDDLIAKAKRAKTYGRFMGSAGGYVVEGNTGEQSVTFYDRSTPPQALYRAKLVEGGTRLVSSALLAKPEPLTPEQQRQVRERKAVLTAAQAQT